MIMKKKLMISLKDYEKSKFITKLDSGSSFYTYYNRTPFVFELITSQHELHTQTRKMGVGLYV